MQTIWRFQLSISDTQTLQIPKGFIPLLVGVQHDIPCLWCQLDPQAPFVDIQITARGTGHRLPEPLGPYLGTTFHHGTALVLHWYYHPPAGEGNE